MRRRDFLKSLAAAGATVASKPAHAFIVEQDGFCRLIDRRIVLHRTLDLYDLERCEFVRCVFEIAPDFEDNGNGFMRLHAKNTTMIDTTVDASRYGKTPIFMEQLSTIGPNPMEGQSISFRICDSAPVIFAQGRRVG